MTVDSLSRLQTPQCQPPGVTVAQVLQHVEDLERCALNARSPEAAENFRAAAAIARRDAAYMLRKAA